jgi:1-acyl-sn-glycerol-3-phosphate acyltransferase
MATRRKGGAKGEQQPPAAATTLKPAAAPSSRGSLLTLLIKLIRFAGVWSWIIVYYPILAFGPLLRFLNPILRSWGYANGNMPSDFIQTKWAAVIVWLSGINVVVEGYENLVALQRRSCIVMPNHSSALDPFILNGHGLIAPKYIFKRSLILQFPPIFLLAWAYGHIPINRSNRESAIKSLHDAAKRIQKYNRAIGIFPEGTRSKDGQLLPFKRGGFHLARETRVPIGPVSIEGAHELYSPASYSFHPDAGTVRLRMLPAIECTESDTVDTLEKKVRDALEKAQKERKPLPHTTSGLPSFFACLALIAVAVFELRFLYGLFF